MRRNEQIRSAGWVAALAIAVLASPAAQAQEEGFELPSAVPDDVFLCVAERPNPEREFLNAYWGEVWEAFQDSGVCEEAMDTITLLLDEEQQAEVERLMDRAHTLIEGVDWEALGGRELVFAERMPAEFSGHAVFMPEMVLLLRGEAEGAASNYEGLAAILDALAGEVNGMTGETILRVDRTEGAAARLSSLVVAAAPELQLSLDVALRGDVIVIGMGQTLMGETLSLLAGEEACRPMSADPRYIAALASLPPAEDVVSFFDMQSLLSGVQVIVDHLIEHEVHIGAPDDVQDEESAEAYRAEWLAKIRRIVGRLMDVPGMVDYVVSVEYTDGHSTFSESRAVLMGDARSKPFFGVIAGRPGMTGFDRFLPAETTSFAVGSGIDLSALYQFLEDSVRVVGPEGEHLLAQWEGLQEEWGIDVAQDVFGWIEGQTVSVTLGRGMAAKWVGMVSVDDEALAREKVGAGIAALEGLAEELGSSNPMMGMLVPRTSDLGDDRLEGFQRLMLASNPMVWGVADGNLIFGTDADSVVLCLQTAAGEHPSIRENAELMSAALLPEGSFSSVVFADRRDLGQEISTVLRAVAMGGMFLPMVIPDEDVRDVAVSVIQMIGKLAPVAAKIDFYESTSSYTTFDGKAWHTRSVTHYRAPVEQPSSDEEGL